MFYHVRRFPSRLNWFEVDSCCILGFFQTTHWCSLINHNTFINETSKTDLNPSHFALPPMLLKWKRKRGTILTITLAFNYLGLKKKAGFPQFISISCARQHKPGIFCSSRLKEGKGPWSTCWNDRIFRCGCQTAAPQKPIKNTRFMDLWSLSGPTG